MPQIPVIQMLTGGLYMLAVSREIVAFWLLRYVHIDAFVNPVFGEAL